MIANELLIIIYTLGIILLVLLIILTIKSIITMNKVEKIVDSVDHKVKSLDGVFNIIDTATDKLSFVSDSVFNALYNLVVGTVSKMKNKEEVEDEEE